MAMYARPLPQDPYNPAGGEVLRYPSPYIPIRLGIFLPVTFLNDWIIRFINIGARVAGGRANPGARHQRVFSESVDIVESVEEGESVTLHAVGANSTLPKARIRVAGRGPGVGRRKND